MSSNGKAAKRIWGAIPCVPKTRTNTWYPFLPFTRVAARLATKDGYKLSFSHLIGPDNCIPKNPLAILPYELPTVTVTNKARHDPTQFRPDGSPDRWDGFGEWSPCTRESIDDEQQPDERPEAVLWACRDKDDGNSEKRGYYLQFANPSSVDIDSTGIREVLMKRHLLDETRLNQLSTEALVEILTPTLGIN